MKAFRIRIPFINKMISVELAMLCFHRWDIVHRPALASRYRIKCPWCDSAYEVSRKQAAEFGFGTEASDGLQSAEFEDWYSLD